MNPFVIAFRRIIYLIPLKRLLVGLAVFSVLLASFSSADNTIEIGHVYYPDNFNFYLGTIYSNNQKDVTPLNPGMTCINLNGDSQGNFEWHIGNDVITFSSWDTYCTNSTDTMYITSNFVAQYYWYYFSNTVIELFKPNFTSLQCQTEYNLIPINSVDQNYCTTNNLCPSGGTPSDCPNVGVSNLYINDIFHPGAFNVIMNIPEEIDWDYAYTNSGQNFNVDIVGYNQDFEKIEGWINTNNYKPSSEDFTNIFTSGFSNFGGLLVAALFVILVFYFVKKLFK